MVSRNFMKSLTAGALVVGLGVTLALAAADDQIKARQAEMKANNKAAGALVAIIKGEALDDKTEAALKAALEEWRTRWETTVAK